MDKWQFRQLRAPALVTLAIALTACGSSPTVEPDYQFVIKDCDESAGVEVTSRKSVKLTVPGKTVTVIVNTDGSLTYGDVTAQSGTFLVGSLAENHMVISALGDPDGNGHPNIGFKSVCPAPPLPPITPTSLHGTGKYAAAHGGVHAFSSKGFGNVYRHRG